jgi:hypothetical protein
MFINMLEKILLHYMTASVLKVTDRTSIWRSALVLILALIFKVTANLICG